MKLPDTTQLPTMSACSGTLTSFRVIALLWEAFPEKRIALWFLTFPLDGANEQFSGSREKKGIFKIARDPAVASIFYARLWLMYLRFLVSKEYYTFGSSIFIFSYSQREGKWVSFEGKIHSIISSSVTYLNWSFEVSASFSHVCGGGSSINLSVPFRVLPLRYNLKEIYYHSVSCFKYK